MIPVDRADVLDSSLEVLQHFATQVNVRGRFVSLYLGLRRMRADQGTALAELGSAQVTVSNEIEQYLDRLYTKSHRQEPFVVLTAPFGGSTSPEAPYSALSGTRAPGRGYPTNTWRNNFGIQKGVGCPAEPDVIEALLNDPQHRLACPHMALDPDDRHLCSIRDTAYRGEEHAIWLRLSDGGYQVVNLDRPAAFRDYLRPSGHGLPVFPLIGMLYCMAPPGVYPGRTRVGIPEFATDFGFTHNQVQSLFDCDPESEFNAAIALRVEDARVAVAQSPVPPTGGKRGAGVPATGALDYGVPTAEEVPTNPPDAALNTGVGAEIVVARELEGCGWTVRYRANQRGLGYDLEATREGQILRVEVKSSVAFADLEMQESEWRAAQKFGEHYVLAVVDFYGSEQRRVWYVRNPAANAVPAERNVAIFRFARADVEPIMTEVDFL